MKLDLSGTEHIACDKATALAFLVDSTQVSRCLPDLQEVPLTEDRHFVAIVKIGLGPVRGRFKMDVTIDPQEGGDTLQLSLKGMGMGSGLQMHSALRVEATGEASTDLHWTAEAAVSGPLASVGGRLLEGQAKKTTEQLFAAIRTALEVDGKVAVT